MRISTTWMVTLLLSGCAAMPADLGPDPMRTDPSEPGLSLRSSTGERGVLRTGDSLGLRVGELGLLDPDASYRFEVTGAGGALLGEGDVRTDAYGMIFLATVMHDVGEDRRVEAGSTLGVALRGEDGEIAAITAIRLDRVPDLQAPGWNVEEVAPPHIFAADEAGEPANAFAVGGADPGELVGPVHIAGEGFPEQVAGGAVDVYVVRDRDEWRERALPREGDEDWIAGPIEVPVDEDGRLVPTAVLSPERGHVGIYDLLVDVDRDGLFSWRFDAKDGADGLGRVGFTVQYSAAYLRELAQRHVLVNIAYDSHERDGGRWRNEFDAGEPLFLYLNPPVMHRYHYSVTKWIVPHQDFETFWNDPARIEEEGGVEFASLAVSAMDSPPQTGCTNTAPTCFGPSPLGEYEVMAYDVVFDRNGDGRYEPGVDLLDVASADTGGGLLTVEQLRALPAAQRVGFTVRR